MSQQTLDTLQQLKDEYEQNDVHEKDSIGHFVRRQAVKLGFTLSEELSSCTKWISDWMYLGLRYPDPLTLSPSRALKKWILACPCEVQP